MNQVVAGLLDLLFPARPRCAVCGQTLAAKGQALICPNCLRQITWISPFTCQRCGVPLPAPGYLCLDCAMVRHYFDRASAVGVYGGVMQETIYRFKYSRRPELAAPLGKLMADKIIGAGMPDYDLLLPVPLYPGKEAERGFNQAGLLAREVGRHLGLPVNTKALARVRDTLSQSRMNREQRRVNVRGAFAVPDPEVVGGKRVLLIDDVYTTGSTVDECARMLRAAGAVGIDVLSLAVDKP